MAKTIAERIEEQIAYLRAERKRINDQAFADTLVVDNKIAVLKDARKAMTPDVEAAYAALKAAGFVKE